MFGFGLLLTVAGLGSAVYGIYQNNDLESQLTSIFSSGTANPGTIWIIGGVVGIALGVILMIIGKKRSAA